MNKLIQKQFEDKLKKVKASRDSRSPSAAIKRFMLSIDEARIKALSSSEFCMDLAHYTNILEHAIRQTDTAASVYILWANKEEVSDAREFQLEAVHVVWSEEYVAVSKCQPEIYTSYISLALEDLI